MRKKIAFRAGAWYDKTNGGNIFFPIYAFTNETVSYTHLPYLEKGVITGCLRISKESIFTGLNNLENDSVLHTRYADSFGFTEDEVKAMLAYYDLAAELPEVKRWYDGYLFNETEISNPWSILKYVNDRKDKVTKFALPDWSNTSSNSIVREMVGEMCIRDRVQGGYHD